MTLLRNVDIKSQDSASVDAFGRWRVSSPVTLFDSKQILDNQSLFWDDQEVSGSGTTSTYTAAKSMTRMGVSANTAGKRVRQTFMRFNYQPGKSNLTLMTAVMSNPGSGIEANVGQHDDDNGIFFQAKDGVMYAVIRSSTSGSAVDTKVAQSSWNTDKMDGTGASGVNIDPTKCQILWWDYEWLGVGRVRMGFVVDGAFIICHQFRHANSVSEVYMTTPNLPLRYSIENDGTGAATTLDHICATIITEAASEALGFIHYTSTQGTHVDANVENTVYAVLGIRLKSTHLDALIDIVDVTIAEHVGSKTYEWMVLFNPTIAGTFTYSDVGPDIAIQSATGALANTVTNGHFLSGGMASSATKGGADTGSVLSALKLGSAIDGTQDEMVLCVRPIGGSTNIDVEGSFTIRQGS